jgi:dihydroorotate dehydrogenase
MMYTYLIKPILFLLYPETVHHLVLKLLKWACSIPGGKSILRSCYQVKHPLLHTRVFGLDFPSPVGLAAGFDKNAEHYNELEVFGFSFIEIGTVTPKGQPGNPKPRSFRLPSDRALINRMGFNNMGADEVVKNLNNRGTKLIIGGNIGKNTSTPNEEAVNDYLNTFRALFEHVDYFVINVSCPNISDLSKLQDVDSLSSILSTIARERDKQVVRKPVLLKISPDLHPTHLDEIIELVPMYGIDGIVATNTTVSRENLATSQDTIREIGNGGLSGKPLQARSTEIIRYIHEKSGGAIPMIAVGGM